MPDIGRHNQSNTVAPKYMPGNPEPLAQQTVNHSDVAYNCGNWEKKNQSSQIVLTSWCLVSPDRRGTVF